MSKHRLGFVSAVPCAHNTRQGLKVHACPGRMDLRSLHADLGGNQGFRTGLTAEQTIECEVCHRKNVITGVFKEPYLWLRAHTPKGEVTTHGPASAVPCPHCGKHDNFMPLLKTMASGGRLGQIDDVVDDKLGEDEVDIVMRNELIGADSECDAHDRDGNPVGCRQRSKIIAVKEEPRIRVAASS